MPLGTMIQIRYRHCLQRGKGLIRVPFENKVVGVGRDHEGALVDDNLFFVFFLFCLKLLRPDNHKLC